MKYYTIFNTELNSFLYLKFSSKRLQWVQTDQNNLFRISLSSYLRIFKTKNSNSNIKIKGFDDKLYIICNFWKNYILMVPIDENDDPNFIEAFKL